MISRPDDAVTDLILAEEMHLRRVARRLVRCESDADDLVQDTLLRAYRARNRFEPGTSVRAWTTTILRRVFLTVLRGRRRGPENDTDAGEPLERTPATPSFHKPVPAFAAFLDRLEDPVKRALERVPEIYRAPFLFAVIDDMSYSDIAARLGVPEGTVMSRIHRARRRLTRDLADVGCDERAARATPLRLMPVPAPGACIRQPSHRLVAG